MIELYEDQKESIKDLIAALGRSTRKSVIFQAATGFGKTVVFCWLTWKAYLKGSRTLILTDRSELLDGTSDTLKDFGLNPSYVIAGRKHPPDGKVVIAMAQTLKNRLSDKYARFWLPWFKSFDMVIIDECHKQEFNKFFEHEIFKGITVIGFSATPFRYGKQRQLGEDYDEIVYTLTIEELIERGRLMPDMLYKFDAPDTKGVGLNSKGDFLENAMFKKYDNPKMYKGLSKAYLANSPNDTMIVFAVNQLHCVRVCKELNDAGIKAKFITSGIAKPKRPDGEEPTPEKADGVWIKYFEKLAQYKEYNEAFLLYSGERKPLIKSWKAGDFPVMVNAGILTTGFDYKAIEAIATMRATVSEVLFSQMLGRASRTSEATGKTHFKHYDFGGNTKRLGSYRLDKKGRLWHEGSSGGGVPNLKECGDYGPDKNGKLGCGDYVFASIKICHCGYVFPEKAEEKEVDLELAIQDTQGNSKVFKPVNQMNYTELEQFAKASRFKQMWVIVQIYLRDGEDGLESYRTFKGYKHAWKTRIFSHIPAKVIAERIEKTN